MCLVALFPYMAMPNNDSEKQNAPKYVNFALPIPTSSIISCIDGVVVTEIYRNST